MDILDPDNLDKIKDFEKAITKQFSKSNAQAQRLRRMARSTYVVFIIMVLAVLMNALIRKFLSYESIILSSNKKISIFQSNCKLYFQENNYLPPNIVKLKYKVPGENSTYFEVKDKVQEFSITNPTEKVDGCWVEISLHEKTVFKGGLVYEGDEQCRIIHEGPPNLDFGHGDLIIRGEFLDINFQSISARKFDIKVDNGELYVHNFEVDADSYIETSDGDVVLQSLYPYNLEWKQDSNLVCLSAPFLKSLVNETGCDLNTNPNPKAETTKSCKGKYLLKGHEVNDDRDVLLEESEDQEKAPVEIPTIYASAELGNVFGNIIPKMAAPVDPTNAIVKGNVYDTGIGFDKKMKKSVDYYLPGMNDSSKADALMTFDLGNIKSRAQSSYKFLVSENPAFLDAKPYWIEFYSMTLLVGEQYKVEGRLSPGFCPYYPLPNIDQLGQVATLVRDTMGNNNEENKNALAFIYGREFATISEEHMDAPGFRKNEKEFTFYQIYKDSEGEFQFIKNQLSNNTPLLLAVLTSLVLASFIGLMGMIGFVFAVQELVKFFLSESEHLSKYAKQVHETKVEEKESESTSTIVSDQMESSDEEDDDEEESEEELLKRLQEEKAKKEAAEEKKQEVVKPKENAILRNLKNLPSQYLITDHLVFMLTRSMTNAAEEFYHLLMRTMDKKDAEPEEEEDEEKDEAVSINAISSRYEKFCFLKKYPEIPLQSKENDKFLIAKGWKYEKRKNPDTAFYTRIKFRMEKISIEDFEMEPDETSLDLFLKSECEITGFGEDTISIEEFKNKYSNFCMDHNLPQIVVTTNTMDVLYGIKSFQKELTFMVRDKSKKKKEQLMVPDLKGFDQCLDDIVAVNLEGKDSKIEKKANPLVKHWIVMDLVAVILHYLLIIILMAPPIALSFFIEVEINKFTLAEFDDVLQFDDFLLFFHNIPLKLFSLEQAGTILSSLSFIYGIISLCDMFFYYFSLEFPLNTLKLFRAKKKSTSFISKVGRIFLVLEWGYIFLVIGIIVGYISLVLVWFILGAILNPNAYLAYAAAAGTFITYIQGKIRQLQDLQKGGRKMIEKIVYEKIKQHTDQIMKRMLINAGLSDQNLAKVVDVIKKEDKKGKEGDQKSISYVNTTSVGKAISAQGLDVETTVQILKQNDEAIIKFAKSKNIPTSIAGMIIAIVNDDSKAYIKSVQKLSRHPAFEIPPELVKFTIKMMFHPGKPDFDHIISKISTTFYTVIKEKLGKKIPLQFEFFKLIFPQILTAIKQIKKGEIDSFIDKFTSMNKSIINVVKEKSYNETHFRKGPSVENKLFNSKGDPVFAIPKYMLSAIQLFRIPFFKTIMKKMDDIRPLLPPIYQITRRVLGAEEEMLDLFSLIFSEHSEKSYSYKDFGDTLVEDLQLEILSNLEEKLEIKGGLVKLFYLMNNKNFKNDENLFSSLSQLMNETGQYGNFTPKTIQTCFKLAGFFKSKVLDDKYLIEKSELFSIDTEKNAEALINLCKNRDFSGHALKSLAKSGSDVLVILSKELRINKKFIKGLICLFKGDFENEEVDILLKDFFQKKCIDLTFLPILKALLTLFTSTDSKKILNCLKVLKIQDELWVLMAKKLIHPQHIDPFCYEALGVSRKHPSLKDIDHLEFHTKKFDRWLIQLQRVASKNYKSGNGKNYLKAPKLLTMFVHPLTQVLLEKIIRNYMTNSIISFDESMTKHISAAFFDFLCVKDIILGNKNRFQVSIKNFSNLIGIHRFGLEQLVNLTVSMDPDNVQDACNVVFKDKIERGIEYHDYGQFIIEQFEKQNSFQRDVEYLGKLFHIPTYFLCKLFAPFLESINNLKLDDIYNIFETVLFNTSSFENTTTVNPLEGSFERLRYILANMIVSNCKLTELFREIFGNNQSAEIGNLCEAILADNSHTMLEFMRSYFEHIVVNKMKVPQFIFDIYISLLALLQGNCDHFFFQTAENQTVSSYELLSQNFMTKPSFFHCIDAIVKKDENKLIDSLTQLSKDVDHSDEKSIRLILQISAGKEYDMKYLAEKLNVNNSLLEVSILLAGFAKNEAEIPEKFKILQSSPSFIQVCKHLKLESAVFVSMLKLSYNNFDYTETRNLIGTLQQGSCVDLDFLNMMICISRSYVSMNKLERLTDGDNFIDLRKNTVKTSHFDFMANSRSIMKTLKLDPELAFLAMRIRQGDFYYIQDTFKSKYIDCMLPNYDVMELTMGLCGALACPINFPNHAFSPNSFMFSEAIEKICITLEINPLIPGLLCYDAATYLHVEEQCNIPKQELMLLILSIKNLPLQVKTYFIYRDLCKKLKKYKKKIQTRIKELDGEEAKEQDDSIKFDNELYDDLTWESEISTNLDNEMLETFIFNSPQCLTLNKESLIADIKKILRGTKIKPSKVFETMSKVTECAKKLTFSWLNSQQRNISHAENLWAKLKHIFKQLSQDPITRGMEFQEIDLSQIIFFSSLFDARSMTNSRGWDPVGNPEVYNDFMGELGNILYGIECISMLTPRNSKLYEGFDRTRVVKFIGMALNVRISNMIETVLFPSIFDKKQLQFNYRNPSKIADAEELEKLNLDLGVLEEKFHQTYDILKWEWKDIDHFLNSNILEGQWKVEANRKYAKKLYKSVNPYDKSQIERWDPECSFPYEENAMMDNDEDIIIDFKKLMNVKPSQFKNSKPDDIDKRSLKPVSTVLEVLQKYEAATVVDYGAMDLIMSLAVNKLRVFDRYKNPLKKLKIIKNSNSIRIYQTLGHLLCMRRTKKIKQEKLKAIKSPSRRRMTQKLSQVMGAKESKEKDKKRALKRVNHMFKNIYPETDSLVSAELLLLAHRKFKEVGFDNLAKRYQIGKPTLMRAFFFSEYPLSKIKNKEFALEIISPLIHELNLKEEKVQTLIKMMHVEPDGILELGMNSSQNNDKLHEFLRLVDWSELRTRKLKNRLQLDSIIYEDIYCFLKKLDLNPDSNSIPFEFTRITALTNAIINRNFQEFFTEMRGLEELGNLFDIRPGFNYEILEIITRLSALKSRRLFNDQIREFNVEKDIEGFTNVMKSLLILKKDMDRQVLNNISPMLKVLYSSHSNAPDILPLQNEAKYLSPKLNFLYDIEESLRVFKGSESFLDLRNSPNSERIIKSIFCLIGFIVDQEQEFVLK